MKDRIIESYLKDFVEKFDFTALNEAEAFERFVNYCVISKHHPDSFDPDEVGLGGGGDLGLDGLGVLVNEHLVFSRSDVDYFKKMLRRLDVQVIFIQAKTSPRFDGADIGTFFSGVRQFCSREKPLGANNAVIERHEIKEYIFDSSIDMDRSPICRLYYVTTGTWTEEPALRARIDQGVTDINQTGLFSSVEFIPVDAEGIKRIYRELHHKIVREVVFEKHTILPQISGVQEAYIGIVPCLEYLKLISDDEGSLNRRLFYDNVRDFQGHNPVNREIQDTVQDAARNNRFALLNNGVTIVARDINKVGATFRLKDYQIVNGCQTSHILYLNRQYLTREIFLPLKLIVTTDIEVTNQIIQGTNRQTEVKLEAFESLAPFQKELEELYLALGRSRQEPLYYERRSKQYDHLGIRRDRIITLPTQVNCFLAMFLNEPHSTHRYYGELLSSYKHRLFSDSHSRLPYFVSGTALATLEHLIGQGQLPRNWRPMRFQLLMVFRVLNEPNELPVLNSRAIEKYCDALLEILEDEKRSEMAFERAGKLMESLKESMNPWREPPQRTRAFTNALLEVASGGRTEQPATTTQTSGTVSWYSDIRGYGFITCDDGGDVFVHYSSLAIGYGGLLKGQRVQFTTAQNPRGLRAIDVEVI
jgi:cold shock CspA family protein